MIDSAESIMSDKTASEYKEEETPRVVRSSVAVIIVGISFLSVNDWGSDREQPLPHD
jgi:hypothetical protein